MRSAKIVAIIMTAVLSLAAFSGCTAWQRDNDNPQVPAISEPDVVSRLEEGADRLEDNLENGVSRNDEGIEINRDESLVEGSLRDEDLRDESLRDESRIEADKDNSLAEVSGLTNNESIAAAMSADFSEIGALSNKKDTGFPGGPVDSQNRPGGPVAYQQKYSKYGAYFIVPNSKKIYLTFDEGYENGYTSKILDILKEKKVKAVFFITYPYATSEPALVKRMVAEGHTLGNHSTKHLIFPDMPLEEAAKDIMNLHNYVLTNYGYEMSLFRPPEGAFSEQTLALVQQLGYNTMLWSFAYKDYDIKNQPIAIEATANIVNKAHPGEICLLHAVSRTNTEILGDVIDQIRAKGFTFADYFYFK